MSESIDRQKQYLHETLVAGTDDLRAEAVRKVGLAISHTISAGIAFVKRYQELDRRRAAEPIDRFCNPPVYPPLVEAVLAVDALVDARVQNLMADPGIRASFNYDRAKVASGYPISGTVVEVVDDVLRA